MSSELVERLRERAESYRMGGPSSEHTAALLDDAAARIEALEAEKARLREALAPFAALAHAEYDDVPNVVGVTLTFDNDEELGAMPFGCFRAARRAREGGNADG